MPDRLRAAEALIAVAHGLRGMDAELQARLARVQALVEVGRVDDAEFELPTYARLARSLERHDLLAFVASRRAFLAAVRGRYEEPDRQADLAHDEVRAHRHVLPLRP